MKLINKLLISAGLISSLAGCASQSTFDFNAAQWQPYPADDISPAAQQYEASMPNYRRLVTSTYLTYPEWYIVYSSQEYADDLKTKMPSHFPYFSSIAQYWWGYGAVNKITKNRYPADGGDHLMLSVIGASYSLEYVIKGLYENSIGKATEVLSGNQQTEEDRYAQKVAEEYANYIPEQPWYDFSYMKSLGGLWTQTSFVGPHMIRKVERKAILSVEYSVKAVYSSIIQAGSHLTYGTVDPNVYALANNVPNNKHIKRVKTINGKEIVSLPSEQGFTDAVTKLTNSGMQFNNIAGNNEILVTAVAPRTWKFNKNNGQLLFTVNILTQPNLHRIAIRVPVKSLMTTLRYLQHNKIRIEHVYAY